MSADEETLRAYDANIDRYAAMVAREGAPRGYDDFTSRLPAGGTVLELGCGTGNTANRFHQAGFAVDPVDASGEMVNHVKQTYGLPARQLKFEELDAAATYDGVWASFSLLHAPKADFPDHLRAIHRALKPGGWFSLGLKLGEGEERDSFGRYYAYYTLDELFGLLAAAGFTVEKHEVDRAAGMTGDPQDFTVILSHA